MREIRSVIDISAPKRSRMSPAMLFAVVVAGEVALATSMIAGIHWWTNGRFVEVTNDAYLQADQVTIAPKVQGYVEQVFVRDNQRVTPGQPLVRIDQASYDAVLSQEAAALGAHRAEFVTSQRQIVQQRAAVERAEADLAGARADATFNADEAARLRRLSAQGVETRERAAQANDQAAHAAAMVRSNEATLRQAQGQVATLQAQSAQVRSQVEVAEAQLRTAQLNLGDTVIHAGVGGRVGDKTVRVGQFVQPGTRLMTIVPVQDVYLVANFKETQIGRIRIGQLAKVKIDALGDHELMAVVDSFAPGTGAEFALLPPENATGNFSKVVQRVPVRLRLSQVSPTRDYLLPGLSATVRIDTTRPPVEPSLADRS